MLQGHIIEYVEHGTFITAYVLQDQGSRLHLLNQHGRELNLPAGRVVHTSTEKMPGDFSHSQISAALQELSAIREKIILPAEMADVWQLASEEESESFEPAFLAELCFGRAVSDDELTAFLRHVFAHKLYFKYRSGQIHIHSPEAVEQIRERLAKEAHQQTLIQEGAKTLERLWKGEPVADYADLDEVLELIKNFYLFGKDAEQSELARKLVKESGLTGPHDIYHLMIKAGVWQEDENIPLLRYDLPLSFTDKAIAQTQEILTREITDLEGRQDFRNLPILTIDGADTRDFDDALHIEKVDKNYRVGIHVADVSAFIGLKTPLFDEARQRASSVYFPEGQLPMLPEELSQDKLSLIAGQDRLAVSFLALLSESGELLESKIVRSVINVKRQLSYDQAEPLCTADPELAPLWQLSQKLRTKRIKAGALIIPVPDVVIEPNSGTLPNIRLADVETSPRVLVSEFMVLANTIGATYLAERQIPAIYRTQGPPHKRFFSTPQKDLFINFLQRKFLARGDMTTSPAPHSGVGVEQYTTLTSPIRRLLDLLMQHQLCAVLKGEGPCFADYQLKDFIAGIISSLSRVNLVSNLRNRYWLLKHLEAKVGNRLSVFVLDRKHRKVQVVLKDYLIESELPQSQSQRVQPGDYLMVKLARVNALDNVLRLEW